MEVFFLIVFTIFLCFVVLIIDKDFFSPPAIICEVFIFSLFILSFNVNKWNVDLSFKTIVIIIVGNITFVITSLLCRKCILKHSGSNSISSGFKLIKLPKFNINILIIFSFFITIIYVIAFYKSVGGFDSIETLSKAINYYRVSVSYNLGDAKSLPTLVVQLYKILKMFSLICIYIFINNLFYYKSNGLKYKKDKKYILPIIMCLPLTLLTGNRTEFATMLIAVVIIYNFFSLKTYKKINFTKILKCVGIVLGVIMMFSLTTNITGRTSNSKGFDYFSIYFGGPLQLFDMYIDSPIEKSTIVGKETFWSLNNFFFKLQGKEEYQIHLEPRHVGSINLGNAYTAYRNIYQDFGFIGIIALQVILSWVLSKMYYKIRFRELSSGISVYVIMYSLMVHVLFFFTFSEQFFNSVISINYLILLILCLMIKFFVEKLRFSFKGGVKYDRILSKY